MTMRVEISDRQTGKTTNIASQMQFDCDHNDGKYFIAIFTNKKQRDFFAQRYKKTLERLKQDDCTVKLLFTMHQFDKELFDLSREDSGFDASHTFMYIDDIETNKWLDCYYREQLETVPNAATARVFWQLLENLHMAASSNCSLLKELAGQVEEDCDIVYLSTVIKDPRRL